MHMPPDLLINAEDGSVSLSEASLILTKGITRANAAAALSKFYRSNLDHGNGYEWLMFHKVNFGGQPCGFALCFHQGLLTEIRIGVSLPNAVTEGGWPTKDAIDKEIAFAKAELGRQLSRPFNSDYESFPWGEVWSQFDPKGFQASAGLRYAANRRARPIGPEQR